MAEVRACDPVLMGWDVNFRSNWSPAMESGYFRVSEEHGVPFLVLLRNGQRIIVRVLSEERKAARRARKIRSVE